MPPYAKLLRGIHRKACKMPPMGSNWRPRVREWVLKLRSRSPWPRRMGERISLAEDLDKRYPLDTQMQSLWLPAIRAQLALNRKNPAEALRVLQTVESPMEYGTISFTNNPTDATPFLQFAPFDI